MIKKEFLENGEILMRNNLVKISQQQDFFNSPDYKDMFSPEITLGSIELERKKQLDNIVEKFDKILEEFVRDYGDENVMKNPDEVDLDEEIEGEIDNYVSDPYFYLGDDYQNEVLSQLVSDNYFTQIDVEYSESLDRIESEIEDLIVSTFSDALSNNEEFATYLEENGYGSNFNNISASEINKIAFSDDGIMSYCVNEDSKFKPALDHLDEVAELKRSYSDISDYYSSSSYSHNIFDQNKYDEYGWLAYEYGITPAAFDFESLYSSVTPEVEAEIIREKFSYTLREMASDSVYESLRERYREFAGSEFDAENFTINNLIIDISERNSDIDQDEEAYRVTMGHMWNWIQEYEDNEQEIPFSNVFADFAKEVKEMVINVAIYNLDLSREAYDMLILEDEKLLSPLIFSAPEYRLEGTKNLLLEMASHYLDVRGYYSQERTSKMQKYNELRSAYLLEVERLQNQEESLLNAINNKQSLIPQLGEKGFDSMINSYKALIESGKEKVAIKEVAMNRAQEKLQQAADNIPPALDARESPVAKDILNELFEKYSKEEDVNEEIPKFAHIFNLKVNKGQKKSWISNNGFLKIRRYILENSLPPGTSTFGMPLQTPELDESMNDLFRKVSNDPEGPNIKKSIANGINTIQQWMSARVFDQGNSVHNAFQIFFDDTIMGQPLLGRFLIEELLGEPSTQIVDTTLRERKQLINQKKLEPGNKTPENAWNPNEKKESYLVPDKKKEIYSHFQIAGIEFDAEVGENYKAGFAAELAKQNYKKETISSFLEQVNIPKEQHIKPMRLPVGNFVFEIAPKTNPINIVGGNITGCCFKVGGVAQGSLLDALNNPYSTFLNVYLKSNHTLVGQSWLRSSAPNSDGQVAYYLDNIETITSYENNTSLQKAYLDFAKMIKERRDLAGVFSGKGYASIKFPYSETKNNIKNRIFPESSPDVYTDLSAGAWKLAQSNELIKISQVQKDLFEDVPEWSEMIHQDYARQQAGENRDREINSILYSFYKDYEDFVENNYGERVFESFESLDFYSFADDFEEAEIESFIDYMSDSEEHQSIAVERLWNQIDEIDDLNQHYSISLDYIKEQIAEGIFEILRNALDIDEFSDFFKREFSGIVNIDSTDFDGEDLYLSLIRNPNLLETLNQVSKNNNLLDLAGHELSELMEKFEQITKIAEKYSEIKDYYSESNRFWNSGYEMVGENLLAYNTYIDLNSEYGDEVISFDLEDLFGFISDEQLRSHIRAYYEDTIREAAWDQAQSTKEKQYNNVARALGVKDLDYYTVEDWAESHKTIGDLYNFFIEYGDGGHGLAFEGDFFGFIEEHYNTFVKLSISSLNKNYNDYLKLFYDDEVFAPVIKTFKKNRKISEEENVDFIIKKFMEVSASQYLTLRDLFLETKQEFLQIYRAEKVNYDNQVHLIAQLERNLEELISTKNSFIEARGNEEFESAYRGQTEQLEYEKNRLKILEQNVETKRAALQRATDEIPPALNAKDSPVANKVLQTLIDNYNKTKNNMGLGSNSRTREEVSNYFDNFSIPAFTYLFNLKVNKNFKKDWTINIAMPKFVEYARSSGVDASVLYAGAKSAEDQIFLYLSGDPEGENASKNIATGRNYIQQWIAARIFDSGNSVHNAFQIFFDDTIMGQPLLGRFITEQLLGEPNSQIIDIVLRERKQLIEQGKLEPGNKTPENAWNPEEKKESYLVPDKKKEIYSHFNLNSWTGNLDLGDGYMSQFAKKLLEQNIPQDKAEFFLRQINIPEKQLIRPFKTTIGNFSFEIAPKTNPINIVGGNITGCCFKVGGEAQSSLLDALNNPYSTFLNVYIKDSDVLVAQSWLRSSEPDENGQVTYYLDNIEATSHYRNNEELRKSYENFAQMIKEQRNLFAIYVGKGWSKIKFDNKKAGPKFDSMVFPGAEAGLYTDLDEGSWRIAKNKSKNWSENWYRTLKKNAVLESFDDLEVWKYTPDELRKMFLFHGTGEANAKHFGFEDLDAKSYGQILWTAEESSAAQTYIPSSGGVQVFGEPWGSLDAVITPENGPWEQLATQMGYTLDAKRDKFGRATSFKWMDSEGNDLNDEDEPTYKKAIDYLENVLGYKKKDYGAYRVKTSFINGKNTMLPADYSAPAHLYLLHGIGDLNIVDISMPEGDLMDTKFDDMETLRDLAEKGYDGVRLNDFAQSERWGNVNHISVGLFPSGLKKLKQYRIPARNFDWGESLREFDTPDFLAWHKSEVQKALDQGLPVPENVKDLYFKDDEDDEDEKIAKNWFRKIKISQNNANNEELDQGIFPDNLKSLIGDIAERLDEEKMKEYKPFSSNEKGEAFDSAIGEYVNWSDTGDIITKRQSNWYSFLKNINITESGNSDNKLCRDRICDLED